ncbi:MAG: DUF6273 domain-containing protein [Coriobacteriales bacterium]|jgi:hypothetical protein|nr:DUF6273 domain-containing protein [Coriobacteriales bacterium]
MEKKEHIKNAWRKALLTVIAAMVALTTFAAAPLQAAAAPVTGPVYAVDGRVLPAYIAGDTSDWIEIARCDGYSLIVRKDILPGGVLIYNKQTVTGDYAPSNARTVMNNWFNGTLPANAGLRNYTVTNNVMSEIGFFAQPTGGISRPSGTAAREGYDIAFLLSFGEAASFCSLNYGTSMSTWTNSSLIAQANFKKLTPLPAGPAGQQDCWWLRSPGYYPTMACSVGTIISTLPHRVWCSSFSTTGSYCYGRPAMWVDSGIFGPQTATINVDYVNAAAGTLIDRDTFTVNSGSYGPYQPKSFPNFTFDRWDNTSAPQQGTIAAGQNITIRFLYQPVVVQTATINVYHIDATQGIELDRESFTVPVGNYGPYLSKSFPGYQYPGTLAPYSDPAQGTVAAGQSRTIVYFYTAVPQTATVNVYHIDILAGVEIQRESFTITAGNYGPYPSKSFSGYQYPGTLAPYSAPAQGTVGANQTVTIVYYYTPIPVQTAYINVYYLDVSTGIELGRDSYTVTAGNYGPYPAKTFPGYQPGVLAPYSAPAQGTINAGQTLSIVYYYSPLPTQTATIHVIHADLTEGVVLDLFTYTVAPGIYGPYLQKVYPEYNVVQMPSYSAPAMGTISAGQSITIIYLYYKTVE